MGGGDWEPRRSQFTILCPKRPSLTRLGCARSTMFCFGLQKSWIRICVLWYIKLSRVPLRHWAIAIAVQGQLSLKGCTVRRFNSWFPNDTSIVRLFACNFSNNHNCPCKAKLYYTRNCTECKSFRSMPCCIESNIYQPLWFYSIYIYTAPRHAHRLFQ